MEAESARKKLPKVPIALPEEIDEGIYPCPAKGCDKSYDTERQLKHHIDANHWKVFNPNKRGRP